MSGRAKAGLAQLSRGELDVKKVRVVTTNFRLQAQVLELPTSRVLWLNTYLPTDPRLQQYDDSELQEVLEEVRNILNNIQFDDLVWGSDLNWDPSRNTQFSRTLDAFVRELGLVSLWVYLDPNLGGNESNRLTARTFFDRLNHLGKNLVPM